MSSPRTKGFLVALVLLLVWASPAQAQFVNDTFTGSDTTVLSSHTGETGATWTRVFGSPNTIVITDANRVRGVGDGVTMYTASGTPASADYDVTCGIYRVTNVDFTGCVGRAPAAATSAAAYSCLMGSNTFYLHYIDSAGSLTELDSEAITFADTTLYVVKLEMRGTTLKCYLDGVERLSATDSNLTSAGRAGVWTYYGAANNTGYHIDYITATNPAGTRMLLTGAGQ